MARSDGYRRSDEKGLFNGFRVKPGMTSFVTY
jgi:hypothetical protein